MIEVRRFFYFISLTISSVSHLSAQNQAYAVKDVNVIPMDREVVLAHQTVLITDGKIKVIGNVNKIRIPKNVVLINGKGNYLMPGLTDMHAHFFYEQGARANYIPQELKMMLANGVTTVRIMNGCPLYKNAREQVAEHKLVGPELFVVSPQFVGDWPWKNDTLSPHQVVTNGAEAKEAVRRYKREGYDEIKITFFIKKPAYDGIVEEAAREHINVTGHIGHDVRLPVALAACQQIEHLDEFIEMLLPDSSSIRYSVSGPSIWTKKAWQTVDYLDEAKLPKLIKLVKDAGVYITPTNYFFKVNFGIGQTDEALKNSADYAYIPDQLLPGRAAARTTYWDKLNVSEEKRLKWYGLRKRLVYELNKAGVQLMTGSDSPEWYIVQGFSVHNELANMVECGLSNFDALKTSTVTPCTYLGILTRKGTVTKGKDADLLLLSKNPLDAIDNTKAILGVFRAGRYYNRQHLNRLLRQVLHVKDSFNQPAH